MLAAACRGTPASPPAKSFEHVPITPNHKLCEVPFDSAIGHSPEVGTTQKLVDVLGARPIDVRSLHQRRSWQAVLINIECRDFSRGAWLLRAELVARKEQQSQAEVSVLTAQRNKPRHLSGVSETGHIYHEDDLVGKDVK
eukprot:CAMPEP_0119379158 /NCGR_PEP_ID=MMETSP1334-20130426/51494_1 /TAXON_ID=127549 /ORGANISM="Calcidiscus leptoporus, Strain RCC1130" /LENGTH=139 /DNA_ID=CAMNT_0007398579 /DNA_START=322 /DNA_END=742 /DNA_ORIENTATION=-